MGAIAFADLWITIVTRHFSLPFHFQYSMVMASLKKKRKIMYNPYAGRSFFSSLQGIIFPSLVKPISQRWPWKFTPSDDLSCSEYAHV